MTIGIKLDDCSNVVMKNCKMKGLDIAAQVTNSTVSGANNLAIDCNAALVIQGESDVIINPTPSNSP